VVLEISSRELPSRRFLSDDELRAALRQAPATTLRGTLGAVSL